MRVLARGERRMSESPVLCLTKRKNRKGKGESVGNFEDEMGKEREREIGEKKYKRCKYRKLGK